MPTKRPPIAPITLKWVKLAPPHMKTMIDEADVSRSRRAEAIDKLAAGFILQGALDFLSRSP